jgi:uncharacterized protein (TIGR00730 family)
MAMAKVSLASIEAQVVEWLKSQSGRGSEQLIGEMLRTILKLGQEDASRGDLKILNRTLKELRHAFKIFAPYIAIRKVSIFGSTRVAESDRYYLAAKELGHRLADEGFMVITGAGPGVMQAGHEGAGREKSFGVNIRLPSVQKANPFIRGDSKLMNFHFFFTRKLLFVKEADAVVIFPGGFGTHDELAEALTLAQTGKSQLVPIILMDLPGSNYWKVWQDFLATDMLARGYISKSDLSLFKIVNDIDEAVEEIKKFYRNYHSYRFVKQDLVIRLNHPPAPGLIDQLNREFADIVKGEVKETKPLPEESDDPGTLHLPRLLFHFNREDFARLRQMIDVINRAE